MLALLLRLIGVFVDAHVIQLQLNFVACDFVQVGTHVEFTHLYGVLQTVHVPLVYPHAFHPLLHPLLTPVDVIRVLHLYFLVVLMTAQLFLVKVTSPQHDIHLLVEYISFLLFLSLFRLFHHFSQFLAHLSRFFYGHLVLRPEPLLRGIADVHCLKEMMTNVLLSCVPWLVNICCLNFLSD